MREPAESLTSSSPRFARPPHSGRTTDVPSYSTQAFDPVKGLVNRLIRAFQTPCSKSKSCWPSRDDYDRAPILTGVGIGVASLGLAAAIVGLVLVLVNAPDGSD